MEMKKPRGLRIRNKGIRRKEMLVEQKERQRASNRQSMAKKRTAGMKQSMVGKTEVKMDYAKHERE